MISAEMLIAGLLVVTVSVALGVGVAMFLLRRGAAPSPDMGVDMAGLVDRLRTEQAELAGQLRQLSEDGRKSQAELAKALQDRLDVVSQRMGQSLEDTAKKTAQSMGELQTRLKVIDEAQKNITQLSGEIVGLQDILANKQARGAFGEVQLNDLVTTILPPSAYSFQTTLSTGVRVDCLLKLPNPPGSIGIDAKFPLESYYALRAAKDDASRDAARKAFGNDVLKHVKDINERYIIPGQTSDSALMFLPSEAVYAELHAELPTVIQKSHKARVYIVSPTTLMATLNTIRAVLKDAQMREQAGLILAEVGKMAEDVNRLDQRVEALDKHFGLAEKDLREIRISAEKVSKRATRIEEMDLDEPETADQAIEKTAAPKLKLAFNKVEAE